MAKYKIVFERHVKQTVEFIVESESQGQAIALAHENSYDVNAGKLKEQEVYYIIGDPYFVEQCEENPLE